MMKKEYTKPQTIVVELKMTTQVLVSSPDTMPLSQDPEDLIDMPGEIH
jgi:hypothetical protein